MQIITQETSLTVIHAGQKWNPYSIVFNHNGQNFSAQIFATSYKDAEQRLASIRTSGAIDGQIVTEIPHIESTAANA